MTRTLYIIIKIFQISLLISYSYYLIVVFPFTNFMLNFVAGILNCLFIKNYYLNSWLIPTKIPTKIFAAIASSLYFTIIELTSTKIRLEKTKIGKQLNSLANNMHLVYFQIY